MPRRLLPLVLLAIVPACKKGEPSSGGDVPAHSSLVASDEASIDAGPARRSEKAASAGERVKIPSGSFAAGSTPGDDGRDPLTEPTLLPIELGPYEIDKLPFPDDPAKPPRVGVTRDEARSACQERGERLCTELEWEHACKGPHDDLFGAGNAWDPACAKDQASCASDFGVLAMGFALREWTDSDLTMPGEDRRRAVVRGASASADGVDHRCAHRAGIDATAKGTDLGFRCCKGPPNAPAIPAARSGEPSFTKTTMELHRISKLLSAIPRLAPYAKDLSFFNEEDAIKTVLSKGDGGTTKPGAVLTTAPVLWTPVPTEEVVVLAVRAKTASLVLAFYKLPEDRFRLAGSLVLKDELGPIVLSHTTFNKKRVSWSTCWECAGEQGAVELRDGKRIVVVHY